MREAILTTARDLLIRYGFRKTTMEDIAAALGKRKSFLYYYYPGKNEVFTAVAEKELHDISQKVHSAVEAEDRPDEQLRAYFKMRSLQTVERLRLFSGSGRSLFSQEDAADALELTAERRRFDDDEAQYVACLIQEGVRVKAFRPLSEKQILLFCQFAFSALRGTELELFMDYRLAEGLQERVDVSLDILLKGLLR